MQLKKVNNIFLLVSFIPIVCFPAFNSLEEQQLHEINRNSALKLSSTKEAVDKKIINVFSNHPEIKDQVTALSHSWDVMIQEKCNLETIESKNTDAEIAEMNSCLEKEYDKKRHYFSNIAP